MKVRRLHMYCRKFPMFLRVLRGDVLIFDNRQYRIVLADGWFSVNSESALSQVLTEMQDANFVSGLIANRLLGEGHWGCDSDDIQLELHHEIARLRRRLQEAKCATTDRGS